MADNISVGSVSVDIVPDTKGFAADLKTKLAGISVAIGISVDTTELRAQLEEVTRDRSATINVDADTTQAEAQIDAAARTRDARVNVDSRGVSQLSSGISGIAFAIIALGPALVPIIAAITALGAGLTLPLVAAGGGLTVFGLLAGKAIGNTNKIGKQIDQLKQKAATLVDPKARAAATAQAKALEASLTGPQRAFLAAKSSLSKAFEGLLGGKNGAALFAPIVSGMQLLGRVMPALSPLILSVSTAITGLLDNLGKAASGGGFKTFIAGFASLAGSTITTAANVIASFSKGLFNLLVDFLPLSKSFGSGLTTMGAKFEAFSKKTSTKNGIASFVNYLKTAGPQVISVIGSIVKALVHIGVALAPIGAVVLGSIKLLSDTISAIPTPILTTVASAILGVVLALKAMSIISTVIFGVEQLSIALGIMDGVLVANPIGIVVVALAGLVAGLVAAYKTSETFRNIVNGVFSFLKGAIVGTIGFVRDHWRLIASILGGPLVAAAILVISNFARIKAGISAGISGAIGFVKTIPGKIKSALGDLSTLLFHAGQELMKGLADGIKSAIGKVTGAISGVASKIKGFLPGSPVKEGPLVSWNHGGAGVRLGNLLADGLDKSAPVVGTATARVAATIAAPVALAGREPSRSAGSDVSSKGIELTQHIYPQPEQSEQEIGDMSASRLLFALAGA